MNLPWKAKKNCWEFKKCGRQSSGLFTARVIVCPAATETKLTGVHGGENSGRACWVVAGTMCEGEVQGTFAQKYKNCEQCDFYMAVKEEEGDNFQTRKTLLERLRRDSSD
jgi:hypothetical protein